MSERKNIDHFFRERLEHSEVIPPETAWENIEAKLKEKKKRRVIPFWWKLSGVAAVFILGFLLLWSSFNNNSNGIADPKSDAPIVNQQKNGATNQNATNANDKNATQQSTTKNDVAVQENPIEGNKTAADKVDAVITSTVSDKNQNEKVASTSSIKNKKDKNIISNENRVASDKVVAENAAASNVKNRKSNAKRNKVKDTNPINTTTQKQKDNAIVKIDDGKKTINPFDEPLDLTNEPNKNTITNIGRKTELSILENKDKKTSDKTIEEIKKIDSTKLASVEPNALEELLNEKEKKIAKGRKENRWQVTPNIAPIYFSSMSNGSPMDEKLAANEKVYGMNYSYGIGFNYAVNKKVKIRSGIHTFSADYDTKGIVFYQNTSASRMQNVTPNLQGSLIQIDPLSNVNTSFGRLLGEKFEGTLNQRMAYIEMPLEVSYALLAKRFGIDVIGGISTLYLSQNDVYLKSNGFNMKIGEANNLNDIHFSTNIGLGLKYTFFKRFDARVEPLFKYQLNTYSSGAGNFKPYIFGVYSGISYRF